MRPSKIIFLAILVQFSFFVSAQNNADLRLVQVERNNNLKCFDIELKSPHGKDINLAGQNYRLFYDASRLTFDAKQMKSYLSTDAYSGIEVLSNTQENVGLLSLSLDSKEMNDEVLVLSHDGNWNKSINVCFDHTAKDNFELIWADQDKTSHFATANIALSEWITAEKQQILVPNILTGYNSQEKIDGSYEEIAVTIFPNPVADYVNVELIGHQDLDNLIIKDVIGREVVFDQVKGKSNLIYDLTNWPDGIYTMELHNDDGALVYTNNLVKTNK